MLTPTPRTSALDVSEGLLETLRSLLSSDARLSVVEDTDAPMSWAVWLDDEIIGAGEARSEALAEALATVRGWEASS